MPYHWTETPLTARLRVWPHNSLPPQGFAAIMLVFFVFASIPLYSVLGTAVLWGLLPFMLMATAALYYALRRNARDRRILEELVLTPDQTRLVRTNPRGGTQDWEDNTYWVRVSCHEAGGPVPFYVTLRGTGREVEIGAFLSEDERKTLYTDLSDRIRRFAQP